MSIVYGLCRLNQFTSDLDVIRLTDHAIIAVHDHIAGHEVTAGLADYTVHGRPMASNVPSFLGDRCIKRTGIPFHLEPRIQAYRDQRHVNFSSPEFFAHPYSSEYYLYVRCDMESEEDYQDRKQRVLREIISAIIAIHVESKSGVSVSAPILVECQIGTGYSTVNPIVDISFPLHSLSKTGQPETHFTESGATSAAKMAQALLLEGVGSLSVCGKRLLSARSDRPIEDMIVDVCIALESLYLTDSEKLEMSFRLRQRSAIHVGSDISDKKAIKLLINKVYEKRSKIVHGAVGHSSGFISPVERQKLTDLFEDAYRIAKIGLRRRLLDPSSDQDFIRYLDEQALGT